MSKNTRGGWYLASAATASTTRSDPSLLGSSVLILSPVSTPEPTTRNCRPVSFFMARPMTFFSSGTTEEMMPPSIWAGLTPWSSSRPLIVSRYSSAVLRRSLWMRRVNWSCSPSMPPSTVLVFPMSITRIMLVSLLYSAEGMAAPPAALRFSTRIRGRQTAGVRTMATMASGMPFPATTPRMRPSTAVVSTPWSMA